MPRLAALLLLLSALLASGLGLQRCATPTPPRGGPIDSIGPVLLEDGTTPNFQTNFRPGEIRLAFDEWVELDRQQEILISPPIELGPDNQPFLKRRTLVIPLDGIELLDSVTYVVNVGSAVVDLNEGNPTENLRFVFATGPELDTATVSGTLVDAFSGEPVEDANFTLYANPADSAIYTANPTYFAQTGEDGSFTVSNVRPGRYRAVALRRKPGARNYFLDFSGPFAPAAVGYLDTLLEVADGDNEIDRVKLSPVPIPVRIQNFAVEEPGVIALTLNQPAAGVEITADTSYLRQNVKDTLRLFYTEARSDTFLLGRNGRYADTLFFAPPAADAEPSPLSLVKRPDKQLNPGEGAVFQFSRPLDRLDTSAVNLYRDTLIDRIPIRYSVDTLVGTRLAIASAWDPAARYRLELLPGAVTDWRGNRNVDTIAVGFGVNTEDKYGDLTLRFLELNPVRTYVVQLVKGDDNEPIVGTRRTIDKRFEATIIYPNLEPATYRVELVIDSNENGYWDGGDIRFGEQPEVVRRFDIEALRANWEVEEEIKVEE